jgi:peptidyl-prolyl cis-trans isomerase D
MVKAFEDAAFAMQPNQISDVVESDFGYHIIQLNDIKQPKIKTLAEMRPDIEAELKKQQAQKKYAEAAEIFTNMVYEQSDSLKPVADKLKLDIKTATDLSRQGTAQSRGPLANPLSNSKLLGLLFAPDALDKKRNTEAVELGGSRLVSGRVTAYTPAQTKPFQESKALAQTLLTARLAEDKARTDGIAKLAELAAAKTTEPAGLGKPVVVSRDITNQQPIKLIEAALKTASGALPAWVGVDLGAEGYRVVRVNKIAEGGDQLAAQNRPQFSQVWTNAEGLSYYEHLKQKYKVVIKAPKAKPDAKAIAG